MVHTFINQSFKIFRVPVISVKLMDMVYYIAPFKKVLRFPPPPLKLQFFGSIFTPRSLIFQVVLLSILLIIIVTMSLYLTASGDNAGVDGYSLVS